MRAIFTGDNNFAAYTINIAHELTRQFTRFATLNPHQLAGHVANLEFWSDELAHCQDVIDRYKSRFDRLSKAQRCYVREHDTIEFSPHDPCCTARPASKPQRVPDHDREVARRELRESFYRFLFRCNSAGLIDAAILQSHCRRHDISVDPADLKHRSKKKE